MAAIYFDPEGYSLSGPRLMGRQAAGHSFLRGLFRHSSAPSHYAFTTKDDHRTAFAEFAKSEKTKKPIIQISPENLHDLAIPGCLFLPGPGLEEFARKRSLINPHAFSLCGVTHTTLSARAMDAITSLLSSPVEPWDAVICTSRSVRNTLKTVLEAEADYLKFRLGATRIPLPKLPIIPLGIITEDFQSVSNDRNQARAHLKISSEEIVILYVGRLSFHAKAHPAAMYQALGTISQNHKVVLIECGWFANQSIENAFDEAARNLAPNVRRIVVDGRQSHTKSLAWQAADIFMSLTDNLQETFGITPIEAMASGLPVIVSDWDGYRDTVRHGIDGFRIPTLMPQTGIAPNSALPYALDLINYDQYCGTTAHFIAVDIHATCIALNALIENPTLRQSMGQHGKLRARSMFDWKSIIATYENLWRDLNEERRASIDAFKSPVNQEPWPARIDPLKSFSSYATDLITQDSEICLASDNALVMMKRQVQLNIFTLSRTLIGNIDDIDQVIAGLSTKHPKSLVELASETHLPICQIVPIVMFGLKIGALRISPPVQKLDNFGTIQ